jgi:hypothetical protein
MLALRAEAARGLGCEVEMLDPETGYLCEIRRGGSKHILLGGFSPVNNACAAHVALDKFHTLLVLRRAGLTVLPAARCLQPGRFVDEDFSAHEGMAPAERFAAEHGFPLVAKPNRGGRGRLVAVVGGPDELRAAIRGIWESDYLALIQPVARGIDLRLDFLDGEYLFGYVRRPVVLRGDGESSIASLLAREDARYADDAYLTALARDPIWRERSRGLGLDAVLAAGEVLDLGSPILNLNRLCRAEYLESVPAPWLACGRHIGESLGLRHFGIDFKVPDYPSAPRDAVVLEVNASPSLAQMSRMGHYEAALAAERRIVRAILDQGPASGPGTDSGPRTAGGANGLASAGTKQ